MNEEASSYYGELSLRAYVYLKNKLKGRIECVKAMDDLHRSQYREYAEYTERLMESIILGRRIGGISVFGVVSNAVSLVGSDIVERLSAKQVKLIKVVNEAGTAQVNPYF